MSSTPAKTKSRASRNGATTGIRTSASKRAAARQRRQAAHQILRAKRPLHKKLLLHPTTVFALLCCGVVMVGSTYKAVADTAVSAVVEAAPLTSAATISSPGNNTVQADPAITVGGSCPTNSYVKLHINSAFAGVDWCGTDHTYHIGASLYSGSNQLRVQAYNSTDAAGPSTPAITVIYQPAAGNTASGTGTVGSGTSEPSAAAAGSAVAKTGNDAVTPVGAVSDSPAANLSVLLFIASDFTFQTFKAGTDFSWPMHLDGGTGSYDLNIDWGDHSLSTQHVDGATTTATIRHTYQQAGYYQVAVTAKDTAGQSRQFQLAALISGSGGELPFVSGSTSGQSVRSAASQTIHGLAAKRWLAVAWPAFAVVSLMSFSFWLGEQRELAHILFGHFHR